MVAGTMVQRGQMVGRVRSVRGEYVRVRWMDGSLESVVAGTLLIVGRG